MDNILVKYGNVNSGKINLTITSMYSENTFMTNVFIFDMEIIKPAIQNLEVSTLHLPA